MDRPRLIPVPSPAIRPRSGATAGWVLREDLDHDAAVLRASVLGLVRRDRLLFAVADDVHLVQRDLLVLVEIPLHRLGALETDPVVDVLRTDVVGVALDLDVAAVRV